jgi:hypothetical protein
MFGYNRCFATIDNAAMGTPAFGVYDKTADNPRVVQFALKLRFRDKQAKALTSGDEPQAS